MRDLTHDDEHAVERLSFYMLKEAYGAVTSAIENLEPTVAQRLFDRIEAQIEEALQRMHDQQSEGPASTAMAMAIAETLIPVLDESHRRTTSSQAASPRASIVSRALTTRVW